MIVVDSSVILELLLRTNAAQGIEARVFVSEESLHAPHLMDLEVAQVIRRYVLAGEMTTTRGSEAIQDLLQLPVTRYPHDVFLYRIWQLRHNMTAYDAAYVTLAEALSIPLLTLDKRLANSRGHKASIELIP